MFDVNLIAPPLPNHTWKGGTQYFSENDFTVNEIEGVYSELCKYQLGVFDKKEKGVDIVTKKEIRKFVMMQIMPPPFRGAFNYLCRSIQKDTDSFYASFSSLYFFNELTDFNSTTKTFNLICNELPHRNTYLLPPDYELIDNSRDEFLKTNPDDYDDHYDAFISSIIQIGKWFDYLRQNGVFDNTRIIIVADHGYNIPLEAFDEFDNPKVPSFFNTLFMVKDFNCNGELKVDNSFMTNADTIFFAKKDLGLSEINPISGKELVQNKKNGVNIYSVDPEEWSVYKMYDKTQFTIDLTKAWHVSDNIFEQSNWITLDEYKN